MPPSELTWHDLPELPPAREATQRTGNGRRVTALPTERVIVRTASDGQHEALYHHATKTFWTLGEKRDRRIDGVTSWAFEPKPPDAA